ncbi:hypothetical protein KM043_014163 [Ampulex compressa]|nr:hypothetical protein KM043_014163 [Ampulex compressa]
MKLRDSPVRLADDEADAADEMGSSGLEGGKEGWRLCAMFFGASGEARNEKSPACVQLSARGPSPPLIVPLIRLNCFLARSRENDITRSGEEREGSPC